MIERRRLPHSFSRLSDPLRMLVSRLAEPVVGTVSRRAARRAVPTTRSHFMTKLSSREIQAVGAAIRSDQEKWARSAGVPFDRGYTRTLRANLLQDLCEGTRREFADGKGSELETKLRALHSSAALACNLFEYWRSTPDRSPLARALGADGEIAEIAFERTFPTGLPGTPPHVDAALELDGGRVLAVESKFSESYGGARRKEPFRPSYFKDGRRLWADRGLEGCQVLAEGLRDGRIRFALVDAPQLLKHLLGLAHSVDRPWELVYLWFDPGGRVGRAHRAEADAFIQDVDPGAVRARSHQELIERLEAACGPDHAEYVAYLRGRYGHATDRATSSGHPRTVAP